MTLRDCEGVNEEREEPQKVPRKRLVTEAMKASSRANGARSKGPITDAGRAKVRFNAIQHGATCKEITFLPGEDEAAFWAKVDQIVEEEGAEGELEIEAIKTAAYSRVTKLRAINAHAIAVTQNMAEIKDHFTDQKQAEVRELIPKIVKAPDVAVTKLMNSSCGCSFLIREFTSIKERLVAHRSFEISQRAYCLQLAGHRPDELFTDPVVRDLNRSYLGSLRGTGGFTIDMAANALMYDRPKDIKETEYTRRMAPFVKDLVSVEQGHAELKKFVHDRIERLKERKELMGYREERELNAALGAAQSPCDGAAEKRQRHINQSDRTFTTAVRLLLALKQERRKYGDEARVGTNPPGTPAPSPDPERPETASDPEEMAPQPGVIPAVNDQSQNEPQTMQVVCPPAANNAGLPASVVTHGPMVPFSAEEDAAIRAQYRKTREKVQEQIDKRAGIGLPGTPED